MIGRLSGALLVALALLAGPALALTSGGRAVVLQPPQPALATNFAGAAGSGAVPGPWSFSRSSNATMVWPDGHLDFAPNNMVLHANAMSGWSVGGSATLTTGVADPFGGTSAFTALIDTSGHYVQSPVITFAAGTNAYENGFWLRWNSGSGQIDISNPETSASGDWTINTSALTAGQWIWVNRNSSFLTVAHEFVPVSNLGGLVFGTNSGSNVSYSIYAPSATAQMERAAISQGAYPLNLSGSQYYGPRYDYTWGQPLLLSERIASTNLLEYSNGFSTAPWATSSVASVVSGAATSRDGTADMWLLEESSTTSAGHYLYQNISKSGSSAFYILNVDAKAATRTRLNMILSDGSGNGATMTADLNNCAAGGGIAPALEGTGITSPYAFYQQFANGICRVSLVVQSNTATQMQGLLQLDAGSGTGAANTTYAGTVGDGLYIAFAELKQQNAPDSYIPTAGAAVTRAADSITTATAGLPGWPNDAGMIVAKFITLNGPTSYSTIVGQGGAQPLFLSYTGGHTTFEFYDGLSNLVFSGSIPVGSLAKAGASWGGGVRSVTAGGATPTVGTYHAGSMGPLGTIGLGSQSGDALSPLWFYEVDIWSGKRPADAVLKNKTSANDNFFQPRQAAA